MIAGGECERLENARRGLLRVHAALLDEERIRYEREYDRIEGSGALLQLVIHDPWFAWLRPVSELIVQIDELLDDAGPAEPGLAEALLTQTREQLRPDEGERRSSNVTTACYRKSRPSQLRTLRRESS